MTKGITEVFGDALSEVGPADSTLRLGKLATWGSGRTEKVRLGETFTMHRNGLKCQQNLNR